MRHLLIAAGCLFPAFAGAATVAQRYAAQFAPEDLVVADAGVKCEDKAVAVASAELVRDRLRAGARNDADLQRAATLQLIDAYLVAGLSGEAIRQYESLDAAAREHVFGGPRLRAPAQHDPARTGSGLAAAYAEAGKTRAARALLDDVLRRGNTEGAQAVERLVDCTRRLLEPGPAPDWFGWRFDVEGRENHGCADVSDVRAYRRVANAALEKAGLPAGWHIDIERSEDGRSNVRDETIEAAFARLPTLRRRADALRGRLAQLDARDARWLQAREPLHREKIVVAPQDTPSPQAQALLRTIEARLAAPLFNPYRFADAPPAPQRAAAAGECRAVNCMEDAQYRWQLEQSRHVDPEGVAWSNGWWLHRIARTGAGDVRWYLGIKEVRPFVRWAARTPFVVDGELRLPLRGVKEEDDISLPTAGSGKAADARPQLLVAKLDDIARDSDGDGLTDLAEQQLLTDPNAADTDGDGIPDGLDSLPNVARQPADAGDSALAAGLRRLLEMPGPMPPGDSLARTLFVAADPAGLGVFDSDLRLVVLPPSLDLAKLRRYPGFSAFRILRFAVKTYGERYAQIVYDTDSRGGTLALEKRDGVWRVRSIETWVT